MKRMMIALTGASMLALAGVSNAESFQLSDAQMDGVTAGATATFDFATAGQADLVSLSSAVVQAVADTGLGGLNPVVPGLDYAAVTLQAGTLAISTLTGAASATAGSLGATLP